jgi:nucleolar protein 53
MVDLVAPPAKRRRLQPSRKGTKAWRKNVDIADVEEHLEDSRKDEMIGYAYQTSFH